MNSIHINGIKGYGYHGCMEEESLIGQLYVVDVILRTDFTEAARTDDLKKTVDYVEVNRVVQEQLRKRSKLIETVTLRIAEDLMKLEGVEGVEVKVCKPSPPINGDVEAVCTTVTL
ncbi:MAG: dihydroneopterin aldolase [Flavobacteriales bacterium]|nr:dihydroneopterin aldolase [Flavobacteriales bacterium]